MPSGPGCIAGDYGAAYTYGGGGVSQQVFFTNNLGAGLFESVIPILTFSMITITTMGECNGNTRLVGSQGSTETYPSTTRTCITRLGYFPS